MTFPSNLKLSRKVLAGLKNESLFIEFAHFGPHHVHFLTSMFSKFTANTIFCTLLSLLTVEPKGRRGFRAESRLATRESVVSQLRRVVVFEGPLLLLARWAVFHHQTLLVTRYCEAVIAADVSYLFRLKERKIKVMLPLRKQLIWYKLKMIVVDLFATFECMLRSSNMWDFEIIRYFMVLKFPNIYLPEQCIPIVDFLCCHDKGIELHQTRRNPYRLHLCEFRHFCSSSSTVEKVRHENFFALLVKFWNSSWVSGYDVFRMIMIDNDWFSFESSLRKGMHLLKVCGNCLI